MADERPEEASERTGPEKPAEPKPAAPAPLSPRDRWLLEQRPPHHG